MHACMSVYLYSRTHMYMYTQVQMLCQYIFLKLLRFPDPRGHVTGTSPTEAPNAAQEVLGRPRLLRRRASGAPGGCKARVKE